MSYHDYEGLAVNHEEKLRLQDDLGDANFMLLRNHGALTMQTIGDAFMHMYDLTRACQIQLQIQATARSITLSINLLLMESKPKPT